MAGLVVLTSCPSPAPTTAPTPQAAGKPITVTSTADSGLGTLRQVLLDAETGDIITFDSAVFPPDSPATIYVSSELPLISQGDLTIDASNAGVILDGSHIGEEFVPCLQISSDGNAVRGLQFVNFIPGAGIVLFGGAQNNTIGGDRSLGSGPVGRGNLVSNGEVGIGLWDDGTSFNTITGNLIGTDATGTDAWSNDYSGVYIEDGASHNIIGPENIIAYNNGHGVEIVDSNSLGNTVTQNSIYDNEGEGIHLWEGGNAEVPAPFIFDFDLAAGTVTGTACANCTIEIFSDSSNEGQVYEGQTTADGTGGFTFNKGASFTGPHLTATAIDADGNTSQFSVPTLGTGRSLVFQEGNNLPRTQFQPKQSKELEDNRIGQMARLDIYTEEDLDWFIHNISNLGFKRIRLTIDWFDWWEVEGTGEYSKYYIDPYQDKAITGLADSDIKIMYCLVFWDPESPSFKEEEEQDYSRFKTEDEIQRYLDYVRFIVHNFKDRVEYFEILNEANHCKGTQQYVELADYINLVKRVAPVIREEYPEAKIVAGAIADLRQTPFREYFFGIINSDIMPLVDGISFHPMYGTSPEYDIHKQYYYEYSSLIQEIKDVASAHGFNGEYIAEELNWRTPRNPHPDEVWIYSETVAAKYYARGIVMHLGMDLTTGLALEKLEQLPLMVRVIRNLSTIMAGAEPASLPIEIQSEATNIRNYSFSLANGDKLLALWTDGVAVDDDPGIDATLTFPGFSAQKVVGIDALNGFEQELVTSIEDGSLIIRNLLIKDYPIILCLTP